MGVDGVDTRFIHSELSLVHRLIFSSVRSMNNVYLTLFTNNFKASFIISSAGRQHGSTIKRFRYLNLRGLIFELIKKEQTVTNNGQVVIYVQRKGGGGNL